MDYLNIDFETRSTVDLRRSGVYPYAEHPDTDIICMAWAFGDEEPGVWVPGERIPFRELYAYIAGGGELRAFNANFERIIWKKILGPRYGFPIPDDDQWYCTAAEAMAMALPRSLGWCADVLNIPERKDDDGHRLMMQMCKPRAIEDDGTIHWWDEEDSEKRARLIEYCKQDVRVERAVASRLRRLGKRERAVYLLDQKINDRGVRLDVPLIEASKKIVKRGLREANAELKRLTDGEVTKVTKVADMTAWLQKQGLDIEDIQKSTVRDLLDGPDELADEVRAVLQIRQDAGKSSPAKLKAMERARCADDRARGLLLYHGAATGRWSGRLIQPQNFPRGSVKDPERYIPAILAGDFDALDEPPLKVIASLLRAMFIPSEGHRFLAGDFSQIEARVLGWIANEPYGDMEYEKMAAAICNVPLNAVTSNQRHVGKTAVLGAGFQMGWKKYKKTVKDWTGLDVSDELAQRAIDLYRSGKPGIPSFWKQIEAAAIRAVQKPGEVTFAGRDGAIRYVVRGQFLWCILPSGRPLAYALPKVGPRETPWGETVIGLSYMGINSYTRQWQRRHAYGGLLTENVVQAMARDIMAEAMYRVEQVGYPIVLSVHDELVADVPEGHGSLDQFLSLMRKRPKWAPELNVEVEGWEGERYKK